MAVNYRKEYIACLGDPIDENPTVVVMDPAFRELGLSCIYNGALVKAKDLGDAVKGIRAMHFLGANVTVPHKVNVMQYLDRVDGDAALIGAVNTLYWKDGLLCGANTDAKGFLTALRDAEIDPAGKRFTILGAGGAARAIAVELGLAGAESITVINRNVERGVELSGLVDSETQADGYYIQWTAGVTIPAETEILINATNVGLWPDAGRPDINYGSVRPDMVVCDVVPNPPRTRFLKDAAAIGCRTLDGLSMLVNQAVIAIGIWTGKEAPKELMLEALRKEFEGS